MVEPVKGKGSNEFFVYENYDLFLNFLDEGLKIITVNQKNEKVQSALLSKDEIVQISNNLLEDEDSLFNIFQEAIKNPSGKIVLAIEENLITISFMLEFPVKKKLNLNINLKEEKDDPMERMRKLILRQANKIEELSKKVDLIKPSLDKFESKKVNVVLNAGVHYSFFIIEANKKIAKRNATNAGTSYHLCAQEPIPQEKFPQYIEIRISSPSYPNAPNIFVGYMISSLINNGNANLYGTDGVYVFYCSNGSTYRCGLSRVSGFYAPTDTIIRVYYDFPKKMISFELDGNILHIPISKSHYNEIFYPVIMAAQNSESVEFI